MGKSTIAQTIAERLFAEGQLGASFFCSRDFEDRRDLRTIFPTIAAQLARRYIKFRSILVPLVRSDSGILHETLEGQMRKLIVRPLMESGISTVIVIDALDECKDDEPASTILSILGQFVEEIPKAKFFITGRPEPRIRNGIRLSLSAEATDVFVLHEVDPDQVNSDVRLFYNHSFSGIRSRHHGLNDWPTEEQLDLLCKRAAGLFIYAMATVRLVDQPSKNPKRQLDRLIQSQESRLEGGTKLRADTTLDSLYLAIFHEAFGDDEDLEDDAKVRSVLGAVILATNPLSPSTIAELLGLDLGDVFPLLSSLHSLLILSEDTDQPVRPFHKSFSDFIVDPARCANPRFRISPPDQHAELVVGCLELLHSKLGWDMCKLIDQDFKGQGAPRNRERTTKHIGKAVEYACESWDKHLNNTTLTQKTKIAPILRRFLEEKVLFWLHVLSALGALRGPWAVIDRMDMSIEWLGVCCIPLFFCVQKFIGPISKSLHLYQRPGGLPPSCLQVATSSVSSSTRARNHSGEDQSRSSIRAPRVHVVGPEGNKPHDIQESWSPPSPIPPSHPGSPSDKAEIDRLDGVSL